MTGPAVALRPMSEEEHERWVREQGIPGYAYDIVRAGALDEPAAHAKAVADYSRVNGPDDTFWWVVEADIEGTATAVGGVAWRVDPEHGEPTLFVMDVEVYERFRGRGFGRAIMRAVISAARDAGARRVGLTVWEGNDVARALYDSLGFRPISTSMTVDLASVDGAAG